MPAEFVKCVDALLREGKTKDQAYAICTTQYEDRHKGHTPQHDEKMQHASLIFLYEEVESARKKREQDMTMTQEEMRKYMREHKKKG
jgi:hypothetical protein